MNHMDQQLIKPILGCVADDFTGASDAASFLVKGGLKTILYNGIPNELEGLEGCSAIVIALKTRSVAADEAVRQTREAFQWLADRGVQQFYFKYCSTFDSTPEGNIGPVIDSFLEEYREMYTVLCPSLPVNNRVVRSGILYVDGVALADSPMKDHPINPMWKSSIQELMNPQGSHPSFLIDRVLMEESREKLLSFVHNVHTGPFYLIPDYETEEDGKRIVELFGDCRFLTGGSGLLFHLAQRLSKQSDESRFQDPAASSGKTEGNAILLSGSCSQATLVQIGYYIQQGGKAYKIDVSRLLNKQLNLDEIWNFIESCSEPVLVYSSDTADHVQEMQRFGAEKVSKALEEFTAALGAHALKKGINRIIVAGGETSGAVMLGLGYKNFLIGESVAPGVPVMTPLSNPAVRLVLKSGNFGSDDFFVRALQMTGTETK